VRTLPIWNVFGKRRVLRGAVGNRKSWAIGGKGAPYGGPEHRAAGRTRDVYGKMIGREAKMLRMP